MGWTAWHDRLHRRLLRQPHWLPQGGRLLLALHPICLDAAEEHQRQQETQQVANEASILHYRKTQLAEQLQEANALKSQFIAGMSHEFRTPLTSIQGYTQRLRRQADDASRQSLNAIERSARHMLTLVDNLLSQGRMDAGETLIHPSATDLDELAEDISALFSPLAQDKNLAFEVHGRESLPDWVNIDALRLRQVLVNLLGNAMKFTHSGKIQLIFDWRDELLSFAVADTGPGIAEEDQEKIFTAFGRTGSQNQAGAGLGLAITQNIIQQMGGKLGLVSMPGEGSRFYATVEAPQLSSEQQRELDSEVAIEETPLQGFTILLAEDDEDIAFLVGEYLQEAGAVVLAESDGRAALQRALQEQPDVVITDMNLPSLNGIGIIQGLRQQHYQAPVFAHTASPSPKDRHAARQAGCTDYLLKPMDMGEMIHIIAQHLPGEPKSQQKRSPPMDDKMAALQGIYRKSIPEKLQELQQCWQNGEAQAWADDHPGQLRHLVHKLAGSARSYGYQSIGDLAAELDQALEGGRSPAELSDDFERLCTLLHSEIEA